MSGAHARPAERESDCLGRALGVLLVLGLTPPGWIAGPQIAKAVAPLVSRPDVVLADLDRVTHTDRTGPRAPLGDR